MKCILRNLRMVYYQKTHYYYYVPHNKIVGKEQYILDSERHLINTNNLVKDLFIQPSSNIINDECLAAMHH